MKFQRARTTHPGLVVSIHDVRPAVRGRVDAMLADLARLGAARTSLLVVPDHHRGGNALEDDGFVRWLHERAESGHEVVLHGYYHLRERSAADGLLTRFVNGIYTAGEGEFYDLDHAEAARRIARGLRMLREAGFQPKGFIAPAWLLGDAAWGAVREAGLEYTVTIHGVHDLRLKKDYLSRSLVYSVRAAWRRAASLAWNTALRGVLRGNALLRLSLHPPDWDHAAIRRHALDSAGAALAGRASIPYDVWLEQQRAQPPEAQK